MVAGGRSGEPVGEEEVEEEASTSSSSTGVCRDRPGCDNRLYDVRLLRGAGRSQHEKAVAVNKVTTHTHLRRDTAAYSAA